MNNNKMHLSFFRSLNGGERISLKFQVDGCRDTNHEINYLEHVQILLRMSYSCRGDIEIALRAPSGECLDKC